VRERERERERERGERDRHEVGHVGMDMPACGAVSPIFDLVVSHSNSTSASRARASGMRD
jgi:hypothetical protein